jgi:PAS domain S-box-containing protein
MRGERKKKPSPPRYCQERYRKIYETAPLAFLIFDQERRVVDWNQRAERLFGWSRDEVLGKNVFDFLVPEDEQARLKPLAASMRNSETPLRVINRNLTKSGRVIVCEWTDAPLHDSKGSVIGSMSLALEVTERQQAEEALRKRAQHFRSLIENALDLVAIVDETGTYLYVSPSHEPASGFSPEELMGQNGFDFVHPDDRPELMRRVAEGVLTGETVATAEYRFRHKNGSWRFIEGSVKNLLADPLVRGLLVNARDITERKQAEEEVRRLNAELEQRVKERTAQLEAANHELESFSYSVSHDLRAPLRAIDGFSQALLEDYTKQLDEQGQHYLQRVRFATQHMGELIDDLLSLSRVARTEMQWQQVDFSGLAGAIAAELRQAHPERQVTFLIATGLEAYGDNRLLRIVLENLLGNAWKYTSKHPQARIELGATKADGQLVYFVSDDGAGFDMRYAGKLFGAFQRLHGVSEFEGTGIGLATVQRIIHRHGGRLWAEAAVEQGATFYFTLGTSPAGR